MRKLLHIFETFTTSSGWKRRIFAFALGVCGTLTLSPFYAFPLIIPAYAGLFVLVNEAPTRRQAFLDGWWWGWGFFMTGLYWFCIALLTDAEKFAWAIPFALFGLTGFIALFPAMATASTWWLSQKIKRGARIARVFLFTAIWLVFELLRGHVLTGFPWNLAGYSFGFSEVSLQSAAILGAYGLTFFTVLLGACLASRNRIFMFAVWSVFFAFIAWGQNRLQHAGEGEATGQMLRIVQANISQPHKWDPVLQRDGLEKYVQLTRSKGLDKVTHIIWPETATPYVLRANSPLAHHLGDMLSPSQNLVTGALRTQNAGENDFDIFNSIMVLDHTGDVIGSYDKYHLVPFGEFLPLRFLIPKDFHLPVGDKDFSRGAGAQTLTWGNLPAVSPLICYEVIFADSAVEKNTHPEWLLTITNDAWFGQSTGPHQHFEMARMRAVEQGLPLVRAANTGISAYVDEYGRIRHMLPLGTAGYFDVALTKSTLDGTVFASIHNYLMWVIIAISMALLKVNKFI